MPDGRGIAEADWKHWRRVREGALQRFCANVLREAADLASGPGTAHERYRRLYQLVERRDRELADIFDSPRRSRAYVQITHAVRASLLTSEELDGFSEGARRVIASWTEGV